MKIVECKHKNPEDAILTPVQAYILLRLKIVDCKHKNPHPCPSLHLAEELLLLQLQPVRLNKKGKKDF